MPDSESPAPTKQRTTPPARMEVILGRDATFACLRRIQAATLELQLDLCCIGEAARLMALDDIQDAALVDRALQEMPRHL